MIFDRNMIHRFFSINRKSVLVFAGILGFLPFCHAAINEDLLQLLSRNPLVQYDDSYYVRVFSEEKYDGTTYTATKVGQILMNRFCSDQTQGEAKRRMKTKIKGLAVIDYQPMYRGSFTTFKFPIQSVECVQLAKFDDLQKTSPSVNGANTLVDKQNEVNTDKIENESKKEVTRRKVAKNNVTEEESRIDKRTSTVKKRKGLDNSAAQDKNQSKQNLNEILGERVVLDNKDKLVDDYHGLIFTEYSNEY